MFVWESDGKVKMPGKRFYSPNFRDVAVLESVQSRFLIFHTFTCKLAGKIVDKFMENYKRGWTFSSTATSLKFGQYNFFY